MCQYRRSGHLQFMGKSARLVLLNVHSLLVLGNYLRKVSYKLEGIMPNGQNISDFAVLNDTFLENHLTGRYL